MATPLTKRHIMGTVHTAALHAQPHTPLAVAKRSGIHGMGLFAVRDIKKGARVIEYIGHKIDKAEGDRRAEEASRRAQRDPKHAHHYIFELNSRWDIDGGVSWNPARHANHSCDPNCVSDTVRSRIWIVALRNIRAGEEITFDYDFDLEEYEHHLCRCGGPSCLGYIVGKPYRSRLRRLLAAKKSSRV
jgi:hypothetical protein